MSSWVLYLSAGLPLLLGFMGVLIALHEDWAKKHRWIVIGAFAFVSILGFCIAVRQIRESIKAEEAANKKADEANEKLHDSMERLGKQSGDLNSKTDEIRRVEGLNTELQNKLLGQSGEIIDSSKQIAELSKQGIANVTGGNSFCYMVLSPYSNPSGLTPDFTHQGNQPLYDVHARIADFQQKKEFSIDIGNLAANSTYIPANPPTFALNDPAKQYAFSVFYDGRNGYWVENLLLRRVGDHWSQAIRVLKQLTPKPDKLILIKVDKDFPVKSPDWTFFQGHWEKVKPLYQP